jgi:hypothetical protein
MNAEVRMKNEELRIKNAKIKCRFKNEECRIMNAFEPQSFATVIRHSRSKRIVFR